MLAALGDDVDKQDKWGFSALMHAIIWKEAAKVISSAHQTHRGASMPRPTLRRASASMWRQKRLARIGRFSMTNFDTRAFFSLPVCHG